MDAGNSGTVNNVFDQSGRLTVANPGADKERTYTYDANGNLTSVSAPNVAWYNRIFGYDALNRLEHAEGPWGVVDFTYDGVGNRLTKVENSQTETYTYFPGTNRLQEVTVPVAYTYDANGNITGIGSKVLVYNQNNRLISVEENSNILGEYTYNGLGQRVIKEAGGVTTVFHYDFNGNIIGESDLNGNFTKEYLYRGKGRLALVDVGTGAIYYYLNDRLGTPQMLTDSSNTVVWEGVYKPFGDADVNPNSSVVNNFRFAGQYYDTETGLHYNWHRYYDPRTGRYLTPDPIGLAGGINLYPYVAGNPVNSVDSYGLVGEEVLWWVPELPGLGPAIPIGIGIYIAIMMHEGEFSLDIDTPETLLMAEDEDDWKKKTDLDNWPWGQENIGSPEPPCEQEPDDDKRCKEVKNMCIEECLDTLGGPRWDQAMDFNNCVNRCMERHGCL